MSCEATASELIDPYIDGELDADRAAELSRHLAECEECNMSYQKNLNLSSIIRDHSLYYRSTDEFRKRIQAALREEP